MTTTRSGRGSSSPQTKKVQSKLQETSSPKLNKKRASESNSSPPAKRGRKGKKEQTTIEESMEGIENDEDVEKQINGDGERQEEINNQNMRSPDSSKGKKSKGAKKGEKNAFDEVKSDPTSVKKAAQEEHDEKFTKINDNNQSIVKEPARKAEMPSSILEKGIIYFFFRPRVNMEDPQGVKDVARSHIILRPIPLSTKLGDGPLEDLGNARLIAVPKKMLPSSPKDRFLSFVENKGASIKELREIFQGSEYATKTKGTSTQPAEQPFAEGVYAFTTTGRESHLAYIITIPASLGDIQNELGLSQRGSFIASVKNPTAPGPANANLSDPAEYPKEIMDKFNGRRWMPLEPELLDYNHAQILLIGEKGGLGRAVEEQEEDKGDEGKVAPAEEMEKLEEEDAERVERLDESDPVFADLGLSAKEFEKIRKAW